MKQNSQGLNFKLKSRTAQARQIGDQAKKYQLAVVSQMLKLATNGFGLVAALAWNNVIKELVESYIKPLIGGGSGIASLFIYATIVTFLAVTTTLQLSKLKETLEQDNEFIEKFKKARKKK